MDPKATSAKRLAGLGAFFGWHACKMHHDVEEMAAERGRLSEEVFTLETEVERLEEELSERDRHDAQLL